MSANGFVVVFANFFVTMQVCLSQSVRGLEVRLPSSIFLLMRLFFFSKIAASVQLSFSSPRQTQLHLDNHSLPSHT